MSRRIGRAAWLLATAGGSGRSPLAPGTAGAAVGTLLFWPLASAPAAAQMAAVTTVLALGAVAATRLAESLGEKDPRLVVVDEVAGMWVSLLGLAPRPAAFLLAFVAFRAMDVLKPWPARDLERLPGGLGIMADDVMAGVYANLLVRLALVVWPGA